MGCDALSQLLHEVHLLIVSKDREVAPRHELDGHLDPPLDIVQGLDERLGGAREPSAAGARSRDRRRRSTPG